MSFLPLTLGVGSSDAESGGKKPPSKANSKAVLARDDFTCRFCGFRSAQYQRTVPFEGEQVTACLFCEQALSLERAGLMGSGVLIWLPEMTQAEVNHVARAIYIARAEKRGEIFEAATRALDALMARRTEAKKRIGSDDPLLLATVMHENISAEERAEAASKLEGIRLMPLDKHMMRSASKGDVNAFPTIVKFWRSAQGPFAQLPAGEWRNLFAKVAA